MIIKYWAKINELDDMAVMLFADFKNGGKTLFATMHIDTFRDIFEPTADQVKEMRRGDEIELELKIKEVG